MATAAAGKAAGTTRAAVGPGTKRIPAAGDHAPGAGRPDQKRSGKDQGHPARRCRQGRFRQIVWLLGVAAVAAICHIAGFIRCRPIRSGIELLFGAAKDGESPPGLHHHFWPFETVETPAVEFENVENIGAGTGRGNTNEGLMLTSDQNIVQLSFTVLWRISDPRTICSMSATSNR